MSELKPCPFCGKEPLQSSDGLYICEGHTRWGNRAEWQHRPIEDELRERIKELEDDKFILEDFVRIYEQKLFEEDDIN